MGYAHIGVYDVAARRAYAARQGLERAAIDMGHAELLRGQGGVRAEAGATLAVKDRFVCYWFHPPGTRDGFLLGHAVDWSEHVLLVRLDPVWSYTRQRLLGAHETAAIEANVAAQLEVGRHLLSLYKGAGMRGPAAVHMIGPRAGDSVFGAWRG